MKGGILGKIGLFSLLFGIPLLFLYILAKGDPNIESLRFYGKEITTTGKYKINDFSFYDVDSNNITKQTLKGKTIVTSILIPSCPTHCPIISQQVDALVYKKFINRPELKDFVILSQLINPSGTTLNLNTFSKEQNIDPDRWIIVTGQDENPIYDIDFNVPIIDYSIPWYVRFYTKPNFITRNLLTESAPNSNTIGGKTYYKMLLLIDKNNFVRGMYQGDKTLELERLNKEIKVLEREYAKEAKSQKK
jgi:protein SCO1/2